MKKSGKSKIILYISLAVILFLVIIGALFFAQRFSEDNSDGQEIGNGRAYAPSAPLVFSKATAEDFVKFEEIISQNSMIHDLPKSGTLQLSFYNYYSGEREWEKYYTLTKGSVVEKQANEPDMDLVMHSKYITALNENNFCRIVQTAKKEGNFGTQTHISTSTLLWRYKGMMDYKDCLGL